MRLVTQAVLLSVLAISAPSVADVVYVQPPAPAQVGSWIGSSSRWTEGEPGLSITADAFELSAPASVTGVKFWGRYIWDPPSNAPTAFRVTLFRSDGPASANGVLPAPGSVLAAFTLNTTDPGFTYTPSSAPSPLIGHDLYEALLPAPVALAADTRYWISIAGIAPSDALSWAWSHSTVASPGQGEYNVFSTDSWWVYQPAPNITGRAWGLTSVPAPATAALLGAAFFPLTRRRSK